MTTVALRRIESIELPSVNWRILCIAGFVICVVLMVFYVWQVNDLTKGFYLINNYEKQINDLTKENKDLQVSFAQSSFWGHVSDKIQALNFQKVASVKYIQVPEQSVATIVK